ncbi:hypothetical protein [Streptomyces sp. KL116D]|uniref:hypothetical protein n=1 Tax=Streptomyces sp. KL116D TaxID=3045152 RepID=UPI0035561EC3
MRARTSPVTVAAVERLVTAMRAAGPRPTGWWRTRPWCCSGSWTDTCWPVPVKDPKSRSGTGVRCRRPPDDGRTRAPLLGDVGSVAEFDRLLDTVLAGIRVSAASG